MLLEHRGEYASEPEAIRAISPKIGRHTDTLRAWLRQHEHDVDITDSGLMTDERQRLKELEREVRELRRSNDILRQASAYFAQEMSPLCQVDISFCPFKIRSTRASFGLGDHLGD
jgi:transposase